MNTFGQLIPVRDGETGEIVGERPAVVARVTRDVLGGQFGSEKDKRVVVELRDGDVIALRPLRSPGDKRTLTIEVKDLWAYLNRCKANLATLEKARERKAAKALKREAAAIRRTDRKIKTQARAEQ